MKKGIMMLMVFLFTFFSNCFATHAAESYYWPVPSCQKITSGRGYSSEHAAIDIPAAMGSLVYATKTGIIKHFFNSCTHISQGIGHNCNNSWCTGNGLYILHDDGTWSSYQYASIYGFSTTSNDNSLSGYSDAGAISSWANTAMKWAVTNEIISGKTATMLDPKGSATRVECATMIMKLEQLR